MTGIEGENVAQPTQVLMRRLRDLWSRFLASPVASEEFILVFTSILIGIGAGIGAVLFRYLIRGVEWVGYEWLPDLTASWGKAYVVIVPTVGGLIVGLLVFYFAREAKGHGVPEVMEAVALKGGRIRPIVAVIKSLASSICIGSGGSVGREGPIVQIGSALGSTVGQIFRLSDERIRNLVACGAAGGIAATFNAPIAGVVFAIEIILGELSVAHFSTIVISSVTASVIGQAFFGDVAAFPLVSQYHINSIWEYFFYPLLGILAALVAVAFVKILYGLEDLFERWKSIPEWFQPAVGGALIGVLALVYPQFTSVQWESLPQIFNVGYEVIGNTLQNQIVLEAVFVLLVLKLLATAITLGSGGSGGVFAPSLFMGAMLGAAFGVLLQTTVPFTPAPAGAYALVGMGAVFAAAAQAPMTAVLILFELTGDYRIILPLMLTVVVATLLARKIMHKQSVYTLKLSRRGVNLRYGRDVDVLQGVQVNEVMRTEIDTLDHDLSIQGFSESLGRKRHQGFPILDDEGKLWGIVTVSDLENAVRLHRPKETIVKDIGTPFEDLVLAYPDESIGDVLIKMGPRGLGRIPVVSRDDPRQLIGVIGRQDTIRAYNIAMVRRSELGQRIERTKEEQSQGMEYLELAMHKTDRAVGKPISELASSLPEDCIIVSIHRNSKVIIPHGHTVLREGDVITVYTRSDLIRQLHESFE